MFNFGEHLKEMRISFNYTQKQVASNIGITERNYQRYEANDQRYEANDQRPSFDILISLADFYNVSLDYLVGRTKNPEINK
ncbi:MAG: XRE family transcriptional regulator [Clostridiales bacterium]|nr:MAG: XRE family transcriptional regulator [Clostridiales bacterium]